MTELNGASYMRFFVLATVVVIWAFTAAAHQCILADNSAAAISAYNACKADMAQGSTGHDHDQAQARSLHFRLKMRPCAVNLILSKPGYSRFYKM